jgi:hypothetical protein
MRREEVGEDDTKRTVPEDAKKACTRCHIMKVSRTEGRKGGGRDDADSVGSGAIQAETSGIERFPAIHTYHRSAATRSFPAQGKCKSDFLANRFLPSPSILCPSIAHHLNSMATRLSFSPSLFPFYSSLTFDLAP